MKKMRLLTFVIVLAVLISGCGGGGGGQKGTIVSGTVVDFDNPAKGIGNMMVQIGTKAVITDGSGKFSIDGIEPGTYWVTATGPVQPTSTDHLTGSLNMTVVKGANDCGKIPVYSMQGIGVTINENDSYVATGMKTKAQILRGKELKKAVKYNQVISYSSTTQYWPYNTGFNFRTSNISIWDVDSAYIRLDWKPLAANLGYKIYFVSNGDLKLVWDSHSIGEGDDPFDSAVPVVRLYIDTELKMDTVNTAGVYQFQIVAYNSDGSKFKELPVITVSIGRDSAPSGLECSNYQLSWDQLDGAEYNLQFYQDPYYTNMIYAIPAFLPQTTNSLDLTGIITPGDYYLRLQAYTFDRAGWTAEINTILTNLVLR